MFLNGWSRSSRSQFRCVPQQAEKQVRIPRIPKYYLHRDRKWLTDHAFNCCQLIPGLQFFRKIASRIRMKSDW